MGRQFILKGCGGHARSVADAILADHEDATIVFVDDNAAPGERIMGFEVVKRLESGEPSYVPAIGDNRRRMDECSRADVVSYVSAAAHIGRHAEVGPGCFVGIGAHVGPQARIGRGTIVNTNAVVEHNVEVGEFCHIAPNSTVCGGCTIGELVLVGAGAVVKPCIKICAGAVIGAGAVVVDDMTEPGVYAGVPARRLARHG